MYWQTLQEQTVELGWSFYGPVMIFVLLVALGVPVWAAHRALSDCIYISEVFARCDDLEQLLERGLEPRQLMRARVSFDERHLAKAAGFRWNDPIKGAWTRRLSDREVAELEFRSPPLSSKPIASAPEPAHLLQHSEASG